MPLPDNSIEKWEYSEHTKVKHEILSKYLSGWIRILGKWHKRVCYFDCFAGRGEYESGEKGSPLIAIETASRLKKSISYLDEIICIFIEKNKKNFENLKAKINEILGPPEHEKIKISCINDEFANVASKIINQVGDNLAPSFFFIDPFGFSGVPFETIKKILSFDRTEVFITFMIRDVVRFLDSPKHQRSVGELYGTQNIIETINLKYQNLPIEQALLKLYRNQLHEDANVKYTFPFKVNADKRLQTTYYLIHATNHALGCELMKEIMWKAGTRGRFGYLGPAEGQMTLSQCSGDLFDLKEFLISRFRNGTTTYRNIRHETLMDTYYVAKHYRQALLELEKEKKVSIEHKGPRGGLLDSSTITVL